VVLPDTWRPGLAALGETIELPPPLRMLTTINERAGDAVAAPVARADAMQTEARTDAVFEPHRAYDTGGVMCFGPCVPWLIQDSCLVPFAQIDGEEPNLFAVYFHPDLYQARNMLPVVHWKHDDELGFVCADAVSFVARG
jgi:hypothetical protein